MREIREFAIVKVRCQVAGVTFHVSRITYHVSRFTLLSLLFAICLLLSACAMPGDAAPVIKIGVIAPFEGTGRPLGYAVLPGIKAAAEEANASGDLGRYRVLVVAFNDDLDAPTAAAQAQALALDPDVLGGGGAVDGGDRRGRDADPGRGGPAHARSLSQGRIPPLLARRRDGRVSRGEHRQTGLDQDRRRGRDRLRRPRPHDRQHLRIQRQRLRLRGRGGSMQVVVERHHQHLISCRVRRSRSPRPRPP